MRFRRSRAAALILTCAASACSGADANKPSGVLSAASSRPLSACELAGVQRARVAGLMEQGKLDRTARVIARADALCPSTAGESRAAREAVQAELAKAEPSDPRALFDLARRERKAGHQPEAQRLVDRALARLEAGGGHVTVDGDVDLTRATVAVENAGRWVAVASGNFVSLRDAHAGLGEVARLQAADEITRVAFSRNGKTLATLSDGGALRLWNTETFAMERELRAEKPTSAVVFSPDDHTVASGAKDGKVHLYTTATGKEAAVLDTGRGPVDVIAFSPDGKKLAVGAASQSLLFYDLARAKLAHRVDAPGGIEMMAFTPDGKTLLTAAFPSARVLSWTVATAHKDGEQKVPMEEGQPSVCALSPDAAVAVSCAVTPSVFDATTMQKLRPLATRAKERLRQVVFSPDGKTMAWLGSNGLHVGATSSSEDAAFFEDRRAFPTGLAFSPDGSSLGATMDDSTVRLWSGAKSAGLQALRGHVGRRSDHLRQPLAFSSDGQLLAASEDAQDGGFGVRVWNTRSSAASDLGSLVGRPAAIAFASGGPTVLVEDDHRILYWDTSNTEPKENLVAGSGSYHFAFSSDRKRVVFDTADGHCEVWDLAQNRKLATLPFDGGAIEALAFSPGDDLVAAGTSKKEILLWSTSDGALVRTMKGHGARVVSIAFAPDGKSLASISADGTLRQWDVPSGAEQAKFPAARARTLARSPSALAWTADDCAVWVSSIGGDTTTLRAIAGRDAGYAITTDAVELLGKDAQAAADDLVCRAGVLSFPFDLCRERYETEGVLHVALRGEKLPE